jgi:hypothetical protein
VAHPKRWATLIWECQNKKLYLIVKFTKMNYKKSLQNIQRLYDTPGTSTKQPKPVRVDPPPPPVVEEKVEEKPVEEQPIVETPKQEETKPFYKKPKFKK